MNVSKMSVDELGGFVRMLARQSAMMEYGRRHPGCPEQAAWEYACRVWQRSKYMRRAFRVVDFLDKVHESAQWN